MVTENTVATAANEVVITLDGRDIKIPMSSLELTMDSTANQVLDAVREVIRENENIDLADENGEYSYAVRKAMNSSTIYVYPKPVAGASQTVTAQTSALAEYSDEKRLSIYKLITSACTHLYSKGKLQEDQFNSLAPVFADLSKNDPLFMAHLTAWAFNHDSKDLKTLSVFFNSLNDADGTPFFKGSSKNKPNLRSVSYALLQQLDPHMVLRILDLCHKKFEVSNVLNNSRHFSTGFKNAFKSYINYREENPDVLRGIRKAGLAKKMMQIYRLTHTAPSDSAASILKWKQKDGREIEMEELPDFNDKTSAEIADIISSKKLSPVVSLSIIPQDKITSSVAKALLNNCTGNQSVILYNWFAKNGFLDVKAINDLFKSKVKEANTAIDRIDTLTRNADAQDKKELSQIRSEKRKSVANTAGLGKIWLHIDASGSMQNAIEFAKDRASIIAECVSDPEKNFRWGLFGNIGKELKNPTSFTKEDFHQSLYGVRADMGSTDCIAMYEKARSFGADIDVYITDQGHNIGTINTRIRDIHARNPSLQKPRVSVIVDFSGNRNARVLNLLESELKKSEIPVAVIYPDDLKESALVAQSVRAALVGEMAIINEIMETQLPIYRKR